MIGRRGRRRKQLLDDLKGKRGYWKLKEEALDRTVWRTRFGRGCGPVVRQTAECVTVTGRLAGSRLSQSTGYPLRIFTRFSSVRQGKYLDSMIANHGLSNFTSTFLSYFNNPACCNVILRGDLRIYRDSQWYFSAASYKNHSFVRCVQILCFIASVCRKLFRANPTRAQE
jgi:hypothetical protein